MRNLRQFFLTTLVLLCSALTSWAEDYTGGSQEPVRITESNYTDYGFTADNWQEFENYYGIRTAKELYGFSSLVNDGYNTINGVLTADIEVNKNVLNESGNLNGTPTYKWNPIGIWSNTISKRGYKGIFDGNGHTISGLYYSNTNENYNPTGGKYVGLFGYCSGTIKNVGVVDSYIRGNDYVGGICGYSGTIINCYIIGYVSAAKTAAYVGGICGYYGTITNCYSAGKVTANSAYVGGICGGNSTQKNCYSTISGTTADDFASGKIAYLLNNKINGGDIWRQNLGTDGDLFPTLDKSHNKVYAPYPCYNREEYANTQIDQEHGDCVGIGTCSVCGKYIGPAPSISDDFYEIANVGHLYWFAEQVNSGNTNICGKLIADIEVNENVLTAEGELNGTPTYSWTPIGTSTWKYSGTFDGNGHIIRGLYFSNTTNREYPDGGTYVGLIGYANNATIKNVGVVDSYFNGFQYVGGICGYNGTQASCYNTGVVMGRSYVGGICGSNGTQTSCYNTGAVTGSYEYAGGICGSGDTQANCYNTGTVSGQTYTGGICGRNGTQTNCYNKGTVNGSRFVGGICGNNGSQTSCYNTGTVIGSEYAVGGICGYNENYYRGRVTNCYYLVGCAKDGNNTIQNGTGINNKGKTNADMEGYTTSITTEEFASGKVTYLLNGSTSGDNNTWRQTLGNGGDAYPVLDKNHDVVFITQPCTSEFSNTEGAVKEHPSMNATGHCSACGKLIIQGTTLVTESNYSSLNLTADFVGYYAISNSAELYWFANEVNNGNTNINAVLTADIKVNENVLNADGTLNGTPTYSWTPIGTSSKKYAGIFDGNRHTISGLYFNNNTNSDYPAGGKYVGLIGCAGYATIKNVGVIDSYFKSYDFTGGICGSNERGNIINCYNAATVVSYNTNGGICGSHWYLTVTNSFNIGKSDAGICSIRISSGVVTTHVNNCYYLAGSAAKPNEYGISASSEEFANGKIGYLLNGNNSTVWHQNLFADAFPTFNASRNVVTGGVDVNGDVTTVMGNLVLTTNYEVAEGKTLYIPANATVTTTGSAVITNNGTIIANGSIAGNNLAGNGNFYYNVLAEADVTITTPNVTYIGAALTLDNNVRASFSTRTFCGKTFTFDASLTTVSYENNRNVGNNAKVTWSNTNGSSISKTFSITPKTLTISNIKAENKTYDGNTATTVSYDADVFAVDIDKVTFGTAATFDNKNVGTGKTVSFDYTKSGADANNYAFATTTGTTTANIEQRELVISSTVAAGKVYDGNTTTTVAIAASNIVSGDVVNFGTAAAFDNKNVGTNKDVNFDFTKSGADAANYKFASETGTVKAAITARSLTLSNFKADSKTYDATTTATGGQFSDDRVIGDMLEFSYNYSFTDKNVETNKDVNFSSIAISGGADKNNYTLATTSGKATADITVKTLNISNIAAANKVYDGNTTTTVSYDADVFNGDKVTFGTAAAFDNKNAGNGKTVSFNYTKSGNDANNYAFADETGTTTANIEQLELVISSTVAAGKVYDGNTTTTVAIAASNIVSGDAVTFGTAAAFDNKNVGTNKTVNFTYTKSGTDADNYKFASATGTAKANITARELTLSNFAASNKVYDGTTEASGSFSDDRVSGDVLEFSYDVEFTNANVAEDVNSVNFSNIAISGGADKDNYNLVTLSGSASANITPVTDEVVVTVAMPTRTEVYNGQGNRYTLPEMPTVFSFSSELYNMNGFMPADMDAWQTTLQNIQQKTDVGEYNMGFTSETFVNISPNFSNVTFNVTDGKLIITPKTGVKVTITENSGELVYNTEEQSVEGYTYSIDDELGIYSEEDFSFSGTAAVAGTTVGTYPMELSADDFSNTNTNYADVEFVIVDGALTITKAPEAPNKPAATMETRYIVTQLVALPENWKWADEQQALEEGDNTATANYDGADKGNYEIESVDVTIKRLPCLHDQGNDVLYKLEPTCTHKGYEGNLSCKLCGKIYQQGDSIPALGHAFDTVAFAPTCTAEGYKELTCSRCNHVEHIDFVPANGHKADSVVFENIIEATCTEAGTKDSVVYCSVCHVELSREAIVIPAAGHKADSVVFENIVEATRTAAGSYDSVVYCSVCHIEMSRTTVEVPQILAQSIKLASKPNKVDYKQGEALDVKGGKITIGYTDKSTEDFEILAGWVSGFDSQKVGEQKLTVTFESVSSTLTTTFNVTVSKEDDNTAIAEAAAEISIYAYNSTIVVEAADALTGEIAVFDVNGRMVVKTLAAGSRTEIAMPRQGLYIVRVGTESKRVVVY